ncbi:hypothetical protein H0E87_009562, partial [Populus deltoides]
GSGRYSDDEGTERAGWSEVSVMRIVGSHGCREAVGMIGWSVSEEDQAWPSSPG